jgi:beta-lactamase superfamily II metal-dependent hydrolase
VVFSAGHSKRRGNPDPEVLARYEAIGAHICRTDTQGSVTVTTNGRRLSVKTHLGGTEYRLRLD